MASTFPESASPGPGHSSSRGSRERGTSPGRGSPARPPRGRSSISFSGQSHPKDYSPTTSSSVAANYGATNNDPNNKASVGGQGCEPDQDRPPKTSSSDEPSSTSATSNSSPKPKQPWYVVLASNYHSISLENKGSVARDHLALERTFLAWLRTSLAFASIGIAITQLFRLNTSLAEQKQQQQQQRDDLDHLSGGNEAEPLMPLSPLMGASLTPEIYQSIKTILQRQEYPIYNPSENSASTLLDQMILHTQLDHGAAARLRHLGKPLGATFLGISIVILFIGFHRYFESQHWIIRGQFPASRGSVALTALVAVALMIACLVVVLVVASPGTNK